MYEPFSWSILRKLKLLFGKPRKEQLYPLLRDLLIQRIFLIPTSTLLILFLRYSQGLHDFCEFNVVPDPSKFTSALTYLCLN